MLIYVEIQTVSVLTHGLCRLVFVPEAFPKFVVLGHIQIEEEEGIFISSGNAKQSHRM